MSKSSSSTDVVVDAQATMIAAVQQVADATKLEGVSVETRQQGKRAVILITDEHGTRLLAYVTPKKAGGYSVEIADYGAYRRDSAKTPAAAAKLVKTSARVKPKAKPEPKSESAPESAPEGDVVATTSDVEPKTD